MYNIHPVPDHFTLLRTCAVRGNKRTQRIITFNSTIILLQQCYVCTLQSIFSIKSSSHEHFFICDHCTNAALSWCWQVPNLHPLRIPSVRLVEVNGSCGFISAISPINCEQGPTHGERNTLSKLYSPGNSLHIELLFSSFFNFLCNKKQPYIPSRKHSTYMQHIFSSSKR